MAEAGADRGDAGRYLQDLFWQFRGEPLTRFVSKVPGDLGEVHIEERASRQGLSVVDWKMRWNRDLRVKRAGSGDSDTVQMVFFVNHGMDWEMEGMKSPIHMGKGEMCMYRDRALVSEGDYRGGCQLLFKSVQIPTERFLHVTEEYMGQQGSRKAEQMMDAAVRITATPRIRRIFAEMEEADKYAGGLADLYLEGKVWELVSEFLGTAGNGKAPGKDLSSRADRDAILQIKERIDRNCVDVPAAEVLAREAGMSLSKFNRNFRGLAGTSLHSYVIERRMELAACLLSEGTGNVSRVASLCGYTNMSHFSAAFKRKYGIVPKDWRR